MIILWYITLENGPVQTCMGYYLHKFGLSLKTKDF